MNIILLGAPGSGKGTLAKFLVELRQLTHLSTGEMLRETMKKKTVMGRTIKKRLDEGKLVPDAIVTKMLIDELCSIENVDGAILDGFPRTLAQAKTLDEYAIKADYVIHLDVKKAVAVERMLKRGRADDTKEIIEKRFEVYNKEMSPVIKYYKKHPGYIKIDSNRTALETNKEVYRFLAVDTTMDNYDFFKYSDLKCEQCKLKTKHHIYHGHTFAEGSTIVLCIKCGFRTLK